MKSLTNKLAIIVVISLMMGFVVLPTFAIVIVPVKPSTPVLPIVPIKSIPIVPVGVNPSFQGTTNSNLVNSGSSSAGSTQSSSSTLPVVLIQPSTYMITTKE